ncbi:hypothetical protein SB2_05960 [Methylobacterium radiotolerans]|nr:hypothetical protein SB3_07175 [Methylobacterium radiotolerans]KTS49545.1 hypothetical protein SB2_05960 [Methylobacterium radiotolerans]
MECEPVEFADPEARAAIQDVSQQLETAGVTPMNLLHVRSGTIVASLTSLGPYVVPVAQIVVPTLGVVLVAWLKMPHRKVRVKIGETVIEATSAEEIERLLPPIKDFQAKSGRKKPAA